MGRAKLIMPEAIHGQLDQRLTSIINQSKASVTTAERFGKSHKTFKEIQKIVASAEKARELLAERKTEELG